MSDYFQIDPKAVAEFRAAIERAGEAGRRAMRDVEAKLGAFREQYPAVFAHIASTPVPAPEATDTGRWVENAEGPDVQSWTLGADRYSEGMQLYRERGTSQMWGPWQLNEHGVERTGPIDVTADDFDAAARIIRSYEQ